MQRKSLGKNCLHPIKRNIYTPRHRMQILVPPLGVCAEAGQVHIVLAGNVPQGDGEVLAAGHLQGDPVAGGGQRQRNGLVLGDCHQLVGRLAGTGLNVNQFN